MAATAKGAAGIGPDGKLASVSTRLTHWQSTQTAEVKKKLAISNRVCFCVPRYLVLRSVVGAAANIGRISAQDAQLTRAAGKAETAQAPILRRQDLALTALESKQKASGIVDLRQTQITARMEGMAVYANAAGTGRVTGQSSRTGIAEKSTNCSSSSNGRTKPTRSWAMWSVFSFSTRTRANAPSPGSWLAIA